MPQTRYMGSAHPAMLQINLFHHEGIEDHEEKHETQVLFFILCVPGDLRRLFFICAIYLRRISRRVDSIHLTI